MIKLRQSPCYLDRLPYRYHRCYRYSVRLFCPYCLDRLLCLYCSRSVPLLNLFTARPAGSAMPPSRSDRSVLDLMLFRPFCSAVSIVLSLLSQPTTADRLLPTVLLPSVLLLKFCCRRSYCLLHGPSPSTDCSVTDRSATNCFAE